MYDNGLTHLEFTGIIFTIILKQLTQEKSRMAFWKISNGIIGVVTHRGAGAMLYSVWGVQIYVLKKGPIYGEPIANIRLKHHN